MTHLTLPYISAYGRFLVLKAELTDSGTVLSCLLPAVFAALKIYSITLILTGHWTQSAGSNHLNLRMLNPTKWPVRPAKTQIGLGIRPTHVKTNKIPCASSEDSDRPGHSPSMIRVFAMRSMDSLGLTVSACGQRRLRSDWADAQADLSLRWAHRSIYWFCRTQAHLSRITAKPTICYMLPAKTQISLSLVSLRWCFKDSQWVKAVLCPQWRLSDQTVWMRRQVDLNIRWM